jgi:acyl-CoA reductase-like NAD-dependent aldehyde dehydrogenase
MSEITILKTYKIFIDGTFPRTESGRFYSLMDHKKKHIANMCLSSRKDFRNGVVAARKASNSWAGRPAFNKAQIIYRIAEILDGRKAQFVEELMQLGSTKTNASKEVQQSIDRCVYYSGWCDKFQVLASTVNPVASNHFNFSVPEPMGVVSVIAQQNSGLLGLVSCILPIIVGGNTCVVLAAEQKATCAISFSEVLATSDVPAGVINILTGKVAELFPFFANHMDVNAAIYCDSDLAIEKEMAQLASKNVKRFYHWNYEWTNAENANPYLILDLQETKTTWHPIEVIGVGGSKY